MAIQFLRGLEIDRLTVTPEPGQPLLAKQADDSWKLYIGDGVTPGGVLLVSGGAGGSIDNFSDISDIPVPTAPDSFLKTKAGGGYEWVDGVYASVDGGTFAYPIIIAADAMQAGVSLGMVIALS